MQHKFPFVVLHFQVDMETVDVNVHPTKMELRFQNQQEVYKTVFEAIHRQLLEPELIPQVEAPEPMGISSAQEKKKTPSPDLRLVRRIRPTEEHTKIPSNTEESVKEEVRDEDYFIRKMKERVLSYHNRNSSAEVADQKKIFRAEEQTKRIQNTVHESGSYQINTQKTPDISAPTTSM